MVIVRLSKLLGGIGGGVMLAHTPWARQAHCPGASVSWRGFSAQPIETGLFKDQPIMIFLPNSASY
ncbi:hypothetical protein QG37_01943 [Candidozyma auris]|nr:hypothetical protein QG37_01943 [[Candida] auris]